MESTEPRPHHDEATAKEKANSETAAASGTSAGHTSSSNHPNLKRAATTPQLSSMMTTATTSATASPISSREPSPTRPALNSGRPAGPRTTRSRNNSQDLSPIRAPNPAASNIPSVPSAAAIQRQLSATGIPHLAAPAKADPTVDPQRPQKASKPSSTSSQHAPANTHRLRSPPPSASSSSKKSALNQTKKADLTHSAPSTPTIVVDDPIKSLPIDSDAAEEERPLKPGMRTPTRGISGSGPTLETVQESSSPGPRTTEPTKPAQPGKQSERPERIDESPAEELLGTEPNSRAGSGNESAGNKNSDTKAKEDNHEKRKTTAGATPTKPSVIQSKKSFSQLPFAKGKTASEGSVKNMTVETETVSSIPQVALGGGAGERSALSRPETHLAGGSLRLKPSNETIRPKKDKKKVVRKAPSGTASSKADIFEAQVASAVDEANSSDSEETFVYESNPPEPHSARPQRFHSRTPSAASTVSQIDYSTKARQDGHRSVVAKKSMKFANNYNSIGYGYEGDGTIRGAGPNGRNTSGNTSHHHVGRHGRGGHASLFDSDSPFPNAAKSPRAFTNHLNSSPRHGAPRSPHSIHVSKAPRKAEEMSYDMEGEGADDERAPLMGSLRTARNRRRPLPGSVRQMYQDEKGHRCCGRTTAFISIGSMLVLLIAAIAALCILTSKPLTNVYIKDIRDVLASEEELMIDLNVHAINPNIIAVQINELNVDIFAKSKHVGNSEIWRSPPPRLSRRNILDAPASHTQPQNQNPHYALSGLSFHPSGIDQGTDPIDDTDPAADAQTMLLGRIYSFDSPLIFDPSPFRRRSVSSIGEVRIANPGRNATSDEDGSGGSKRWQHVSTYDFELIVKGVLKYSTPINSKAYTARVGKRVVVHPNEELDGKGGMALEEPDADLGGGRGERGGVLLGPEKETAAGRMRLRLRLRA
ncbi:hypothetical protein MMC21_008244 [Puttea exsequens]|nr:hypothetical protein [Puttea exsequens]